MKRLDNKGFTLVELVATIIVLSIVLGIGAYSIVGMIKSSKEKDYELLIKNINSAVELYYQECKYGNTGYVCQEEITLGYLITNGYLKGNSNGEEEIITLVNPNDNVNISACTIKYKYNAGKVSVEAVNWTNSCPKTADYSNYN